MKKAMGVISFGTAYADADESCIRPVERALEKAFPERDVYRAFTSRGIVRKLRERGSAVESETELLGRLRSEGYDDIVIVPTHIIPGTEYDRLRQAADGLVAAEPLLADEDDERWLAALLEDIADCEGRMLLVMGHGSDSAADAAYARVQMQLSDRVLIACVEGERTLESVLPALEAAGGARGDADAAHAGGRRACPQGPCGRGGGQLAERADGARL